MGDMEGEADVRSWKLESYSVKKRKSELTREKQRLLLEENGMRNKLIKICVLAMVGTIFVTGCGKDDIEVKRQTTETTILLETTEGTTATPTEKVTEKATEKLVEKKVATEVQAEEKFKEMCEAGFNYTKNQDIEGMKTLIRGADDELARIYINEFNFYLEKNYPDFQYFLVVSNNGDASNYFAGQILSSLTTVNGSDTNSMWVCGTLVFSYIDGEWKFDSSDEAQKDLDVLSLSPEKMQKAYNEGRNNAIFDSNDYTWVNEDITIPGQVDARIYSAWQNEDGTVGVLVSIKNGKNVIAKVSEISMKLMDEKLGTIIGVTNSDGLSLAPGKAKTMVYTIPVEYVKTGSEKWGSLSANCNIKY